MDEIFVMNCSCEECFSVRREPPRVKEESIPRLLAILRSPAPMLRDLAAALAS